MSDLSGVVNEQKATIEVLRRRVAELEGEKATPRQFFSYDPDDGFEEFDTAEEAKAHAETSLDLWRDSAGDGWSDESMRVCWGIICQSIRIVNQQEYDPEKHVFVSPDCAWVEERILCSEDASKEISRLEAENAELKRQVEELREATGLSNAVKVKAWDAICHIVERDGGVAIDKVASRYLIDPLGSSRVIDAPTLAVAVLEAGGEDAQA